MEFEPGDGDSPPRFEIAGEVEFINKERAESASPSVLRWDDPKAVPVPKDDLSKIPRVTFRYDIRYDPRRAVKANIDAYGGMSGRLGDDSNANINAPFPQRKITLLPAVSVMHTTKGFLVSCCDSVLSTGTRTLAV